MSYHDGSECTLTDDERVDEMIEIVRILVEYGSLEKLSPSESGFVRDMVTRKHISVKQLFWLRDIKDRVL